MCAKFFAHICTISSKLCVEPVVCARRSRILRALIAFSCRQQLIKYRLFTTKTSCFLMCAKFFAHICTISSKLCVEPVVCARRSRILRALIAFSCRQQLIKYRLFTTKTSCFFNVCKVFCTHLHNFFEIVRGACRLRSAIANTSCSHRLLLPSAAH